MSLSRERGGSAAPGALSSLVFTVFGDFVGPGEVPVAALVRAMALFEASSPAVRQAVSRLTRGGWLESRPDSGRARYSLTARGLARVRGVAPRLYEPAAEWDGRWRLIVFAIPETQRATRDRLRSELTVLGLAPLAASVWISPRDVIADLRQTVAAYRLPEAIDLFSASYAGPSSDRELLERSWDLDRIASAYCAFIAQYEPRWQKERVQRVLDEPAAFAERVRLVHEFRRFLYLDPGFPSALLPAHWPGSVASALFREYYAALSPRAQRYFERCCALR